MYDPRYEPGGKPLAKSWRTQIKDRQYTKLEEPRIKVLFTSHPYASEQ